MRVFSLVLLPSGALAHSRLTTVPGRTRAAGSPASDRPSRPRSAARRAPAARRGRAAGGPPGVAGVAGVVHAPTLRNPVPPSPAEVLRKFYGFGRVSNRR